MLLVTVDSEGNKSVAYHNIVSVSIGTIKEQQQLIEEMKTTIANLQEQISKQ